MMRWVGVALVLLLTGVALYGVREHEAETELVDEILAYELVPGRVLVVPLHADIDEVNLTSWMVVPDSINRDPRERFEYGVHVSLVDEQGKIIRKEDVRSASRVSGDPAEPVELGRFSARLVDDAHRVTDARTNQLDTGILNGRGHLLLTTVAGERATVLVRLAYAEARSEFMQRIAARTLALEKRRRLLEQSSSLGFADLPEAARLRAVAAWGRRLTAAGRADTDYVTKRLLLGGLRSDPGPAQADAEGVPLGPLRHATFNLKHTASLRIDASPGHRLTVQDGGAEPLDVLVGDSGHFEYRSVGDVPRTLRIRAESSFFAQFSLPSTDASALIGDVEPTLKGGRIWLTPDVRHARFYRLDPQEPVRLSVAPLQSVLRLVVRGLAFESSAPRSVWVKVLWEGQRPADVPSLQATLDVSPTDDADGSPVTVERRALLRLPAQVREVRIVGDATTVVSCFSEEPGVVVSRIHSAYDVALKPNEVWRGAPYDIQRYAGLRPTNEERLVNAGRAVRIGSQVLIDSLAAGVGDRIAERVLAPVGAPIVRSLFTPTWVARGRASAEAIWTFLEGEPTSEQPFWVPESGERAARVPLIYRADPRSIGGILRVTSKGNSLVERPLLALEGELTLLSMPPTVPLAISGLGAGGIVLVGASPDAGGQVLRRQKVFELTTDQPLLFGFQRRAGELLSAWLDLVSIDGAQPYRIRYAIDPGTKRRSQAGFFRRMSQLGGELSATTAGGKLGFVWEAPRGAAMSSPLVDHIGLERVELGDDLEPGMHTLELRLTSALPLWVRASIAGRISSRSEGLPVIAEEE